MSVSPDSRQRLIDAAIEVIATKGESALRLTEVAEMAGLKQPTIHHFFPGREDLVVAAHRERYRRAVFDAFETFDSLVAGANTREEFVEASERGLRYAFQNSHKTARATRIALFAKAETNKELLQEINDSSFEANRGLATVIAKGQANGWIRDDFTPLTLAVWIRSQIFGRYVLEIDSDRYDGDEWTQISLAAIGAVFWGPEHGWLA